MPFTSAAGSALGLDVLALEDVAARAVPAAEVHPVGGWLARATPELRTRRANSVLARAPADSDATMSEVDFADAVDEVERFYAARGRPARFQLTPASHPADLERRLRDRGYMTQSPTRVQTAAVADAGTGGGDPPGTSVALSPTPGTQWWATWRATLDAPPTRAAATAALLSRIAAPCAFAVVRVDGEPAGVGLGVVDAGWLGVFNMATRPDARRRGVARAALRALAGWGGERGAARAYLQVAAGNDGARALYRGAGFSDAYEYAYLTRELGAGVDRDDQ